MGRKGKSRLGVGFSAWLGCGRTHGENEERFF
jgi:hypothetical protein